MNIEQLNKSQIVLLTLLISFVTSIATGIVTVSLMDQAPPVVAQTVNRIVERTIETVAPASQTASLGTTQTVVVKETELISQAVARVSPSIVRLYASSSIEAAFLGLGVVTHSNGIIVTDASILAGATNAAVALSDGTRFPVDVTTDNTFGLAILQATSTDESVAWKSAAIKVTSPVLGQTVVLVSGRSIARVEDGIVTALIPGEGEDAKNTVIDTNISSDSIIAGSPLIDTDGQVIGISTATSRTSSSKGFTALSVLAEAETGEGGDEQ